METNVNNKCRAFTSLEQSKRLAEILRIESADMCFNISQRSNMPPLMTPYSKFNEFFNMEKIPDFLIPCWSLAALLNVLPSSTLDSSDDHHYRLHCMERFTEWYDNQIDACYEMILRLHEQNIL